MTKEELDKKGFGVLATFMKGGDPCFIGLRKKRVNTNIYRRGKPLKMFRIFILGIYFL